LRHPVNAAYEAAAAEFKNVNMIDPFHLEAFPVLRRILSRITGSTDLYKSPTDMGVNLTSDPQFATNKLFVS